MPAKPKHDPYRAITKLCRLIQAQWRPPPRISPTEWSKEYTHFDTSSAVRGKFKPLGWQIAILDAFSPYEPRIRQIVCKKSARLGWTTILQLVIGYTIHCNPTNILVVQPTWEDVQSWGKEALGNLLANTPILRGLVAKPGSRHSIGGNTSKQKAFVGGTLFLIGAQSPAGFRRKAAKIVLMDEISGYGPPTEEGDQPKLAEQRAASYHDAKIAYGSTPTSIGDRIEFYFLKSSRGYYQVKCPGCEEWVLRGFKSRDFTMPVPKLGDRTLSMAWLDADAPENTPIGYACELCGEIDTAQRHQHGRWIGQDWSWTEKQGFRFSPSFTGMVGFHVWSGYSIHPQATPAELVREYREARQDPDALVVFVNTSLGLTWQEESEHIDPNPLHARRQPYGGQVPSEAKLLTCGVDVHGNRLECQVVGWGERETSYVIDYRVFWGDTADHQHECWLELTDMLTTERFERIGYDYELPIEMTLIDQGYNTEAVNAYIKSVKSPRIRAAKGRSGKYAIVEDRTRREERLRKLRTKQSVIRPELIGTDAGKLWTHRALLKKPGERRFVAFPMHLDAEYFDQLTAEVLQKKRVRGTEVYRWEPIRARNEALDTFVYALAAKLLTGVDLDKLDETIVERRALGIDNKHKSPIENLHKDKSGDRVRQRRNPHGDWGTYL